MPIRICLLASGSNGNACLVEAGARRILVDVGIGPIVLGRRLAPLGLTPTDITDVLLTHEHVDHIRGLAGLIRRQPEIRIHGTEGTLSCLPAEARRRGVLLRPWQPHPLGDLEVLPVPVAHDAADPVGFRIETPAGAVGYATDLGSFDEALAEALAGVRALVLESNHCPTLLAQGPYPPYLKARVAGPGGHLSNQQARRLAERLLHPDLGYAALAHLSGTNNTANEVRQVFADLLGPLGPDGWAVGSRVEALPAVCLEASGPPMVQSGPQLSLPL